MRSSAGRAGALALVPVRRLLDGDELLLGECWTGRTGTVRGTDARTLQPVYARELFHQHQIKYGQGFADMVTYPEAGLPCLDLTRIDELVPRELTRPDAAHSSGIL